MNFGVAKFFGAIDKRFQDKYNYLIDLLSKSFNVGGSSYPFTAMPYVGTAPIVESGSNANGSYAKFADGTMICYGTKTTNTAIATGWGSLFINSGDITITFPVAFVGAVPGLSSTSFIPGDHAWLMHSALSITDFTFRYVRGATLGATDLSMTWTAIGKWE